MAEALFNLESTKLGQENQAKSAGILPYTHVIEDTVETIREIGVDIQHHKPKQLSKELLDWADKIILLDKNIESEFMHLSNNKRKDIILWDTPDPYNTSIENYRRIRDKIRNKIINFLISS
jgi:protein-tyrosine-phosphatase